MSIATSKVAAEWPDALGLADARVELTWSELDDTLNRLGNAVLSLDLDGARLAVFAENSAETVLAHLACVAVGVSTIPVSFHLTATELAYILEDSGAAGVFVGPETVEAGRGAAQKAGVDMVVGWRCAPTAGVISWESWLADAPAVEPPSGMPPRPFLHYTSGTTGLPKGTDTPPAMFAGGDTVREHLERVRASAINFGGPALAVGPLYHTGPLTMVRGLAAGVPLVVLGRFDPEATLQAIELHGVASTVMVPTHFSRLLSLPADVRGRYDVSSMRSIIHTGASCPIEVKRQMIDWFGPVLLEAYGGTESGTTNVITSPEWLERPGSVGRTLPQFEAVVVGPGGEPVGRGEVGAIYFRDLTGRGIVYHNDPEKTRGAHLEPGVFTLGEMGYLDDTGYLYITDRASDMVISGGVNIYPAEAEMALLEHPGVADVACIGVPSEEMGEEVKALLVLAEGGDPPDEAVFLAFCRARIAHYKCPRSIDFVSDLGRNAMGKLDKRSLRAPYWPTDRTIGG